jgi:hypothetical protein
MRGDAHLRKTYAIKSSDYCKPLYLYGTLSSVRLRRDQSRWGYPYEMPFLPSHLRRWHQQFYSVLPHDGHIYGSRRNVPWRVGRVTGACIRGHFAPTTPRAGSGFVLVG